MLNIAFDSGSLDSGHLVRGIGVMVGEQIRALKNLETVKLNDIKIDAFDFESEGGKEKLENGNYDIVHYTYFFPYSLTLPSRKLGKRIVVTIQDLIHLIYPYNYPPGIRGRINLFRQKRRLKNVDSVITLSETSKKDIIRFLEIPESKIHVVYLAPKTIFRKLEIGNSSVSPGILSLSNQWKLEIIKRFSLPNHFVLYVGDINSNKNIPNLIRACKIANTTLVICGKQALEIERKGDDLKSLRGPRDWIRFVLNIPHPELKHFDELLKMFKGNSKVIRLGFVPDEDLVKIYNLASIYIQPSLYEGFGLPVLEAMACGTPVIIAKTNALVEIANGAALIADPNDPRNLANKIKGIQKNQPSYRASFVNKGFKRVSNFTWEKTAREMIKVYKSLDK